MADFYHECQHLHVERPLRLRPVPAAQPYFEYEPAGSATYWLDGDEITESEACELVARWRSSDPPKEADRG